MIAAVANLSLARGTAYDVSLLIQDAAGVPLDLSAADLYDLTDTLTWLAKEGAEITAETVPGRFDKESRRYDFAQDSIAFATRLFPAAEGNAATPAPSASAVSDPLQPQTTVSPATQP